MYGSSCQVINYMWWHGALQAKVLKVKVQETTHTEKHYLRRGRPTANTPYRWETYSQLSYQQWFGQFSGGDRINYAVITKSFILQAIFFQGLAFG